MNTAPQAATQAGGTDLDLATRLRDIACFSTPSFNQLLIDAADALARRASPQPVAPDDLRTDYLADSHYLDGLRAGWNMGVAGDDAAFDSIVATRGEQLREARRELRAAQPVALDEQAMRAAFKKWHDENGDQDCGYTWQEAWKTALAGIRPAQIADDHAGDEFPHLARLSEASTRIYKPVYQVWNAGIDAWDDVNEREYSDADAKTRRTVYEPVATQPPTAPVLARFEYQPRHENGTLLDWTPLTVDSEDEARAYCADKGFEWRRAAQQAATCQPADEAARLRQQLGEEIRGAQAALDKFKDPAWDSRTAPTCKPCEGTGAVRFVYEDGADEHQCIFCKGAGAAPTCQGGAQGTEPVGEVILFGGDSDLKEVSWRKGKLPPVGTKLYAAPVPVAVEDARDEKGGVK